MHELLSDVRYAARMLRKTPVVALVSILSLAFAIGVNTSTFSVAKGFLLETFRWHEPERIGFLYELDEREGSQVFAAPGTFLDWRDSLTHFSSLAAFTVRPANLTGGEEPLQVNLVEATVGIFELIGRGPTLGRGFLAEEAHTGAARVAVLSAEFFEREMGADPASLGRTIVLDGEPHAVVGVLPREFDFVPANFQVVRPVDLAPLRHDRESRDYLVFGRLAAGSGFQEATAELQAISDVLAAEHPETNRGYRADIQTLRQVFPGEVDTRLQYILLTVAGFVLIIACANLVNIFLSRADARQTEVALRTALGAGRVRVVRQHLVESLLISLVGGALGIGVSFWLVRGAAGAMPAELPSVFVPRIDALVLAFGILVSVVAGGLLGAAPALQALGIQPAQALGETSRGGTGSRRKRRLRSAFIVAETAAALALLTGAGVLTATFRDVVRNNGDIRIDGLLTVALTADESRYAEDAEVAAFYREVSASVARIPGVTGVSALLHLPRSREYSTTRFTVDGEVLEDPTEAPSSGWLAVGPAYFDTLGVTMLRGRGLAEHDRSDTVPVVVINDALAQREFPDGDAVGSRLTVHGVSREIVGVCGDFMQPRMVEAGAFPPLIFLPFEQHPVRSMHLAIRTEGDPSSHADAVRGAV
ncbi:MAG: ABC transporter permease, partial [Thermoanaerobaculia bacterium]|nr:ABC transporter permease [Thermoanaerobaculia bacterium]